MTTQARNFVRTPRKEKVWAYNRNAGSGSTIATGVSIAKDLLADWLADQGILRPPSKATIMRIVGSIALGNGSNVTASALMDMSWGIAWLRNVVMTAAAGDAQIPDPEEPGQREVQWLQRGFICGTSVASATTRFADEGQFMSVATLDIKQMRKQPTADHGLALVTHVTNLGDGNVQAWINLDCMLALA